MRDDKMETIVIEVDSELLEPLKEIIKPMGLPPEMLVQMFLAWCVSPETKDEARAWLLKEKEEMANSGLPESCVFRPF